MNSVCVSVHSALPFFMLFLADYFLAVNQLSDIKQIFHRGFGQVIGLFAHSGLVLRSSLTQKRNTQRQFARVCLPRKTLGLVLLKAERDFAFRVRCYDENFYERSVQDLGHSVISFQCYYHYYYYKTSFSYILSLHFQWPWMNEGVPNCSAIPVLG